MNTNLLLHFNLWNPLQQVAGVIRVNKPSFPIMHSLLSYNIVEGISNAEDASYCWHIGKSLILATLILTPSDLNSEVFHFLVHFSPFYSIYYNIYTFWGFETWLLGTHKCNLFFSHYGRSMPAGHGPQKAMHVYSTCISFSFLANGQNTLDHICIYSNVNFVQETIIANIFH